MKLKNEKWPPKSLESIFLKKLMLKHIVLLGLSFPPISFKIYRASSLMSIFSSKKKFTLGLNYP